MNIYTYRSSAQTLDLSAGDRTFNHFICKRGYATTISTFWYIYAPEKSLRQLESDWKYIPCDGIPVCEIDVET